MDEDYYSDEPSAEGSQREEGRESPKAVLPLDAFGGATPKPGDEISVRVTRVTESGVEVQISGGGHGDDSMME